MSGNIWDPENIICTNKQQSDELIMLGMDFKTADMCILTHSKTNEQKIIVSSFDDAMREYLDYSVKPA